ncbi:MAG TPA: VOC family protein [Azospirillaceae bacterium]|nr:VOC family protein [Azospirillaceae bacterium]
MSDPAEMRSAPPAGPLRRLHHVGLRVRDPDAMAAFLQVVAGFAPVAGPSPFGGERLLRGRNLFVELERCPADVAPRGGDRPVNEAGITHYCLQGPDADRLHATALAAGARFHGPLVDLGTGHLYIYGRDPEGNVFEMESVPYAEPHEATWAAHIAIATPDIERSTAFYGALLGAPAAPGKPLGPHPKFDEISGLEGVRVRPAWIPLDSLLLEIWQYLQPATGPRAADEDRLPGYAHLGVEVPSLEEACRAVEALGGQVLGPVTSDLPAALARDPDGNLIKFVETAPSGPHSLSTLPDPFLVARIAERRPRRPAQ